MILTYGESVGKRGFGFILVVAYIEPGKQGTGYPEEY